MIISFRVLFTSVIAYSYALLIKESFFSKADLLEKFLICRVDYFEFGTVSTYPKSLGSLYVPGAGVINLGAVFYLSPIPKPGVFML